MNDLESREHSGWHELFRTFFRRFAKGSRQNTKTCSVRRPLATSRRPMALPGSKYARVKSRRSSKLEFCANATAYSKQSSTQSVVPCERNMDVPSKIRLSLPYRKGSRQK